MNRGSARQETFRREEDYGTFLKTLEELHALWRIEVFAYCLMGNHYHVCLRTPEGNLSRVMRHLDGLYTQRFNRAHKRDGSLFRGRYKAIVVDQEAYLTEVVRYIHLNPVEAGWVKAPEAYWWSSHRAYLGLKEAPKWLRVEEVLQGFSSRKEFQRFVASGNETAIQEFYSPSRQRPVLGGETFLEWIKSRVGRIAREHPRYERIEVRPSMRRVLEGVAKGYGVGVEDLIQGRRGRENEARKVAMYLVKRLCDWTLQQTAEGFGVGSYGVVGWACYTIRAQMKSDKKFRDQVERIQGAVNQQKI
jgi:REP-associated tyrosine transposase